MQDMKGFIHLLDTEVLLFGGTPAESLKYDEYFFPIERIFGFHLAPPATEPLDYDPLVANRTMLAVNLVMGIFLIKGTVRMSVQTDFAAMIERSQNTWFSVYDVAIENPFIPQMPAIHAPMLLVNPAEVSFGL